MKTSENTNTLVVNQDSLAHVRLFLQNEYYVVICCSTQPILHPLNMFICPDISLSLQLVNLGIT